MVSPFLFALAGASSLYGLFKKNKKGLQRAMRGTPAKTEQLPLQSKEQEELSRLLLQGIKSGTGPLAEMFPKFNEEQFERGVSQPALKKFSEEILPQLQEKFIAGNQVQSSAMQRAQIKAGEDLAERLAGLRYTAQRESEGARQQGYMNAASSVLGTRPFENVYTPKQPGLFQGVLPGIVQTGAKIALQSMAG